MRSRLALRYSTRSWVGSADTREGQKHMARLVLSLDSQVMAEYNMNKERYTIGRLPDNDIRIDNAAVSGHHSLIINILNDSFLEDLNRDRKSTRLNSSHLVISYAVFCLKKKKKNN